MRLIAGLATLLSLLVLCSPAHPRMPTLVATAPGDGSVVAQAPKMVQLLFNEPVAPAVIKLIDAAGRARDDATVRVTDKTILIALPENLPHGTQVISYRVISEDGHPVAGSMMFSIGARDRNGSGADGCRFGCRTDLAGTDRGLSRAVRRRRRRILRGMDCSRAAPASNVIVAALTVGCLSAVASLGLQGLDLLNLPLRDDRDGGAVASRRRHQPGAVAGGRDRGDGGSVHCATQRVGRCCPHAVGFGDRRRRPVAGGERSCRDGAAAMADPAGAVPARCCRGLLGRRAGAVGWRWHGGRPKACLRS